MTFGFVIFVFATIAHVIVALANLEALRARATRPVPPSRQRTLTPPTRA